MSLQLSVSSQQANIDKFCFVGITYQVQAISLQQGCFGKPNSKLMLFCHESTNPYGQAFEDLKAAISWASKCRKGVQLRKRRSWKRQRGGDLFCFKDVWFTCKLVTCIQRKSHTLMIPIQRYCFFSQLSTRKSWKPGRHTKEKTVDQEDPDLKMFFFWKPEAVPYAFQRCRELLLTKTYRILWNDLAVDGPAKVFFWTIDIISEISNIISWICKPMNSFKCFQSNM